MRKNRIRGTQEAIVRGIKCPNKLWDKRNEHRGKNCIRKGSPYGSAKWKRWLCSVCGKTFSDKVLTGEKLNQKKPTEAQRSKILREEGWTIRDIAATLKVSKTSVIKWVTDL